MEKAKKEKEEAKLQKSKCNTPKKPKGRPRKKSQMKLETEKESNTENCDEGENTYINTTTVRAPYFVILEAGNRTK